MSVESNGVKKQTCTPRIKNLMNIRKRLVKKMREDKSLELRNRVRSIDTEIKGFWNKSKSLQVRRIIKPGNSQSLWKAVNMARDVNLDSLPRSMCENAQEIQREVLPDKFASFFHNKIVTLLNEVIVDENVYNGTNKTHCCNSFYMDLESVVTCMKGKKSTSTLSSDLLSQISRAIDNDEYVVVASLDMSSAFDLVNINLLVKRLFKIGLPSDVVNLISAWLRDRSFYVSIDGESSVLFDLLLGTVQGSILGPVLYAIFVSPIFDIADLSAFADDKYVQKLNVSLAKLIIDIEKSLEAITKWLKKSGLIVNQGKTEACLFYKHDCAPVTIQMGGVKITTKTGLMC